MEGFGRVSVCCLTHPRSCPSILRGGLTSVPARLLDLGQKSDVFPAHSMNLVPHAPCVGRGTLESIDESGNMFLLVGFLSMPYLMLEENSVAHQKSSISKEVILKVNFAARGHNLIVISSISSRDMSSSSDLGLEYFQSGCKV
jgi:hypothetical protein